MNLTTPLGKDVLLINRLHADEGLSQLFRYSLEMLQEETTEGVRPKIVEPSEVLGQPMVIKVGPTDERPDVYRYFHGICVNFSQGNRDTRFTAYRAELVPAAWLLTQITRSRIFQQKSVPDILKLVFEGLQVKYEIQGTFHPRNYCVQYHESDWDFASRLMEEEGIFYFFEHTESDHTMVVANTGQSHRDCPHQATFPFTTDIAELGKDWAGGVLRWRVDSQLRTGKYTTWDHNFQLPGKSLEATELSCFNIGPNQKLEFYDFPGEYAKRFDGIDPGGSERSSDLQKVFDDRQRTVKLRQQEIDVAYKNISGGGDALTMIAGHTFTLAKHPNAENNAQHILVTLEIDVDQTPTYETDDVVADSFRAKFVCIPKTGQAAPFRPLRKTEKPIVYGSQTAVVVGPSGEEIFTDKYGRVKVQFHWDREATGDSDSSCWIRVATPWAGNKWGSIHIPRVGMEVVINFLEGDPDQPIIVGAVYNPNMMPPYTLPDEKTKSTLKSNSSKGGNGFNELRFEDKAYEEQIFIHAQRNQDINVKNDCMESIGNDRHLTVANNQHEEIKGDKHVKVVGDHNEQIGSNVSLKVGADKQDKIGTNYALDAGMAIHIKAGMTVVIEAGVSLTLKVGGNFINLSPGGIFINGTMVMINSGGSPGSGAGCNPDPPKPPKAADTGQPGRASDTPARRSPPPKPNLKIKKLPAAGSRAADKSSAEQAALNLTKLGQVASEMIEEAQRQQAENFTKMAIDRLTEDPIGAVADASRAAGEAAMALPGEIKKRDDEKKAKRLVKAAKSVAEKTADMVKAAADGLPFVEL